MGKENHDRLDKVLSSQEYMGMACGSLGGILVEVPGGSVNGKHYGLAIDENGQQKTEKKYCGPDCPTLIAEHKAGG